MSQIWYAAFSEDFVEQAQKIFKKLDKDVIVTVWDPELVPEMLRRGVSVILGRGATALRIRQGVGLPGGNSLADTQGSGPAGGGDTHPL